MATHPKICAFVLDAFCQPFSVSPQLSDSGVSADSHAKRRLKLFDNTNNAMSESAAYDVDCAA